MERYLKADERQFIIRKYMSQGLTYSEAKQKLDEDKKAIAKITKEERIKVHTKKDSKNKKFLEALKNEI